MDKTKFLRIRYDAVLYAKGTDQYYDWCGTLTEEKMRSLEEFVTAHMTDRGRAIVQPNIGNGSYNMVVRFSLGLSGGYVALKLPKPGHSAGTLAAEKIENEAAWTKFLKEKTTIPVPHVYSYGTEPSDLLPLGLPYILMDWVPGENLRDFLDTSPSKELLSTIYQQIASFYLELYRVPCEAIGSVVKDTTTGQWAMRRPLTIDMHQLVLGVSNYSTNDWPTRKFTNAKDYLDFVSSLQSKQLWNLRNINAPREQAAVGHDDPVQPLSSEDIARLRFEARYRFKELSKSSQFCLRDNFGPFRAFNPGIDVRNMTVDTTTGQILGVFGFEFTNAMPAQFACDPPLTLFKMLPGPALDAGYFEFFLREYRPVVEQFLDAMRSEELKLGIDPLGQESLSRKMRDSWESKRVWFNYALNHSAYIDALYWAVFHDLHPAPELPAEVKVEMESYVQQVKYQLAEHKDSWVNYLAAQKSRKRMPFERE